MCDLLCATPAATGAAMLFAKNSDRPPTEEQRWEWRPAAEAAGPRTTATYVPVDWTARPAFAETFGVLGARPVWGWGMEQGVNEVGLAAGNATIYTTLDPRGAADGLTGMDLVRLVLERTGRAVDAVALIEDLLATVGQGGSGHAGARRPYWSSFLLADPHEAYVVETSGAAMAVERVEGTRATSNRTTIPAFDREHRHPRQPVAQLVDPRLRASDRVLAERPVTVEGLRDHLRSHAGGADGWTICMHVEDPAHAEATTASMVAELPVGAPPVVHHALGSPCQARWTTTRLSELG